jgi:UDP-N-acetylglucosamine diphosphorylase / glucose-1-phosphate thymidylyltransferase / UDP-N-acetylgalactosamine diphosphorylase / glucosamine-1-phosphate N-acetyltransferase / galactosamine-1-phosphate N-acetyltransferase
MDCIILAGGKGTRMMPLTANTPKPLLMLHDQPILEWSLRTLRPAADRVIVVVKYLKEQIEAFMQTQTIFDDYALVEQLPQPLGTGHALMCCQSHLYSHEFIVVNGDDLFHAGAIQELARHPLGLLTVDRDDPTKYGVVVIDDQENVVKLHEKPPRGLYTPPVKINIGAYKLNRTIFDYDLPLSERGEYELTDYVSWLAQREKIRAVHSDFWMPIGSPEDLYAAREMPVHELVFGTTNANR